MTFYLSKKILTILALFVESPTYVFIVNFMKFWYEILQSFVIQCYKLIMIELEETSEVSIDPLLKGMY